MPLSCPQDTPVKQGNNSEDTKTVKDIIPANSVKVVSVTTGAGESAVTQYWGIILNADFASDIICLTYSK